MKTPRDCRYKKVVIKQSFKKEKKFIKSGGKFITHVPFPKII